MADVSDVENALVTFLTGVLYPSGVSQSSIIGSICRVYRGWPNQATLNNDLAAGVVNVTVSSDNESGRTTTRYLTALQASAGMPGVSAVVQSGNVVVGGTPEAGDVIGVLIDGAPFAYRIQAGDTPALVAANLTLAIQGSRSAAVSGTVISIPGSHAVAVRCVADGLGSRELRRQEKDFRVISWCPTPPIRDSICSAIDGTLSSIAFLPLSNGTQGRIVYKNTASYDQAQNALLYRRDLIFSIEYPTMFTSAQPSMLFGCSDLNDNSTYG